MRSSFLVTAAPAALVVLLALPAGAASLTAETRSDGAVAVKEGDKAVASFVPKTAKAQRGPVTVAESIVRSHRVVAVRIPVKTEVAGREEVWLGEHTAGAIKVIWWNVSGPIDADAEASLSLKISPDAIVEYQTARRLWRCDGVEVPLFRRVWDFAKHAFVAAGPELPPAAKATVRAQRGGAPAGKALGGFFFSAASSSAGATDAAHLRPPTAVNDENPATVWATAGSAAGELLTARSSGGFRITGLRLVPGNTSSESAYRTSARPKRLTLVFGADKDQHVDVELVEDADGGVKRMRDPFWIRLPKPVASACMTVVIRSTTSDAPMAIADLDVMTELDGPEAVDRLVSSLAQATSCQARTPLLVRLGGPALSKVCAAIEKAPPGPGRECLISALATLVGKAGAPPEAGPAAVAAISGATPDEEKTIVGLVAAMATPPLAELDGVLGDERRKDDERARAALMLAAIDAPEARARLLAAVGHGSPALRKSVRILAARLPGSMLGPALAALRSAPSQERGRRADLLAVVGALAARQPSGRAEAVAALRAALEAGTPFEEQGRAIQALGAVQDRAAIEGLVAFRSGSKDGVLRALATSELADAGDAGVIPALRAALADEDPQVRETAASSLGRKHDQEAAALLIAGAKQEPWPRVRRAEIAALGELCTPAGNELLLRAFQKDVEDVRQIALTGLAHCHQGKATGTLLRTLGRQPESADMRSLAARLLGERKDPRTVQGLGEALTRLLTESQADLSLEGVIADTAMALATIRTPPAIAALAGLISDPRPSVQRMGVDALAVVCDPGPGAAALRAAAQSKDESVASRAAAAETHCRDPR